MPSHHEPSPAQRKAVPSPEELKKLPPDGGPDFNRLVFEKSPYLLQHAANPVDWYPWGEAAFEKAKRGNKPVFLSIGYSTCHWCHVMEHESFEDDDVAKLLNDNFVAIKVDREERPDIDQIYMTVCQALTGQGGWPLTVIMTPDKKPFFAGTYFPKSSISGRPGMMELIPHIVRFWKEQPQKAIEAGEELARALQASSESTPGPNLTEEILKTAYQQYTATFDSVYGGFGQNGPKFPSPHNLSLLLRLGQRLKDTKALEMVEKTFDAMRHGGMFDHLGFGFHRYSTDREFLVPHFEKMLYDQAIMVIAAAETYQATGKAEVADIARETLTYMLRDMTSPEGGFLSAEDADSEGVEGKFYVWTKDEIIGILGPADGAQFCSIFSITDAGNFYDEVHNRATGTNILHLQSTIPADLRPKVEAWREKLFNLREKRVHPYKDDKILTAWNGLTIAALAKCGHALQDSRYIDAARRAADFILSQLQTKNGRLLRSYRHGPSSILAFQEDYAAMVWGLLELYEATFEVRYLKEAIRLNRDMIRLFWDEKNGGFFVTGTDGESLIARTKEFYDGAIPSGNSIAALNLARLARITGDKDMAEKADRTLAAHATEIGQYPIAYSHLVTALDFSLGPVREIVIAGKPGSADVTAMLNVLRQRFMPGTVVLFHPDGPAAQDIEELAPWIKVQKSRDGHATAYVCENYSCKAPTTDVKKLEELIKQ